MIKISRFLSFFVLILLISAAAMAARTEPVRNIFESGAPFVELIQVTPSNTTVYVPPLRGCIVEAEGDLAILAYQNDDPVTITVVAGQLVPALIKKVMATGTSATVVCGK